MLHVSELGFPYHLFPWWPKKRRVCLNWVPALKITITTGRDILQHLYISSIIQGTDAPWVKRLSLQRPPFARGNFTKICPSSHIIGGSTNASSKEGEEGGGRRKTLEDSSEGDHPIVQMLRKDQDSKKITARDTLLSRIPSQAKLLLWHTMLATKHIASAGWPVSIRISGEKKDSFSFLRKAQVLAKTWRSVRRRKLWLDLSLEDEFNSHGNRISNRFIVWAVNCRKDSDNTN